MIFLLSGFCGGRGGHIRDYLAGARTITRFKSVVAILAVRLVRIFRPSAMFLKGTVRKVAIPRRVCDVEFKNFLLFKFRVSSISFRWNVFAVRIIVLRGFLPASTWFLTRVLRDVSITNSGVNSVVNCMGLVQVRRPKIFP